MMTATVQGFVFTDEQRAFQSAICDFCAREAGTREQRDRLTSGGEPGAGSDVGAAQRAFARDGSVANDYLVW